jgi:hypothetical protein
LCVCVCVCVCVFQCLIVRELASGANVQVKRCPMFGLDARGREHTRSHC